LSRSWMRNLIWPGAVAEAHQEAAGLLGDPVGFAGPDAGLRGRYPGL
jgi:hypothetical protein